MDKELKAMRDKERARKAKFGLENPDGLELHTSLIEGLVKYASEGGGSIEARAKGKKRYDSKRKIRTVQIPESDQIKADAKLLEVLSNAKKIIFVMK